ncbi:MAG: aldehyde:ferredoxin oxidoreductase, partial [Deltaproteobacteria bacterium]|nr:aldehyde:ferredoxin oxidoreductase [Deltaproteobacteria bacterium]
MKFAGSPLKHGYTNKMITVDLKSRRMTTPGLDPQLRKYFLGGRALGLYLLHRRITAQTSPHDPENPLIFAPGPLAGIPQFPGTSKCMAVSLSQLTGIPGISNFGGHFGAYLKYAGFDALEITGKSDTDVMIVIDGIRQEISIREAPPSGEVFDLEKAIVDQFIQAGRDRKEIVFLTTGVGAAYTTYG